MALFRAGQAVTEGGYVEKFNGGVRGEMINEIQFLSMDHVRVQISA